MFTDAVLSWIALAVPLLPVGAFVLLGAGVLRWGRPDDRGERVIAALTGAVFTLSAAGALVAAGIFFASPHRALVLHRGAWFSAEGYSFDVTFLIDRLSVTMMVLTSVITGAIGRFSFRYLHREPGFVRFFMLLTLFAAGMLFLVEAGSADLLAVGWEMVGLSSALLIAYFHHREAPVRASFRAYVTYRACDVGLLVGAVLLHQTARTTDFAELYGASQWPAAAPAAMSAPAATWIALAFVLAAMGKSALFPVGGWLPRAMEGPTPSSALFYGALSVHAGVYLLLRLAPLFERSPVASGVLVVLGLVTALYGNLVWRVQSDVKSALAFASMTQVGLMVAEVGLGWHTLALVHLVGHSSLRGLQLLRAPSALVDALRIQHANEGKLLEDFTTGTRLLSPAAMRRTYWLTHARFHLDVALGRVFIEPFLALARALDRLDRRSAAALGVPLPPGPDDAPAPAPAHEEAAR